MEEMERGLVERKLGRREEQRGKKRSGEMTEERGGKREERSVKR